jgi:hypothetical protein
VEVFFFDCRQLYYYLNLFPGQSLQNRLYIQRNFRKNKVTLSQVLLTAINRSDFEQALRFSFSVVFVFLLCSARVSNVDGEVDGKDRNLSLVLILVSTLQDGFSEQLLIRIHPRTRF